MERSLGKEPMRFKYRTPDDEPHIGEKRAASAARCRALRERAWDRESARERETWRREGSMLERMATM